MLLVYYVYAWWCKDSLLKRESQVPFSHLIENYAKGSRREKKFRIASTTQLLRLILLQRFFSEGGKRAVEVGDTQGSWLLFTPVSDRS